MKRAVGFLAAVASPFAPVNLAAREVPISVRSTFRLGSAGVICSAQIAPRDPRLSGMFDRGYTISCRDAAGPVGTLIAVRHAFPIDAAPVAGVPASAGLQRACGAPGGAVIEALGNAKAMICRDTASGLDYRCYALVRGEGYLRNNGSSFAESAAFFEVLAEKARSRKGEQAEMAEALANEGLQQSNLGNFDTAARLFGENERAQLSGDGLGQRLLRNYRALDQLNQRRPDTAGMATIAASSEAGVTTGGNYALDGLVRAFTGAGARAVIASHWPVPDDFNATRRLIGGLIAGKAGVSVGDALAGAEAALMDDPQTSHPFYWAAFVVVGDAAKPAVAAATPR